jgi:hypothetical protein
MEGLRQRAAETRRLLRQIARKAPDAPNIIDGAVLTCTIAGRIAYFEADSLAAAAAGKLHVVEVKSFQSPTAGATRTNSALLVIRPRGTYSSASENSSKRVYLRMWSPLRDSSSSRREWA